MKQRNKWAIAIAISAVVAFICYVCAALGSALTTYSEDDFTHDLMNHGWSVGPQAYVTAVQLCREGEEGEVHARALANAYKKLYTTEGDVNAYVEAVMKTC